MRVLLLGAGGMLAQDLIQTAPPGVSVEPLTKHALDITDPVGLERAVRERRPSPDYVVNTAAFTDVDDAERQPELAYAVNSVAVRELGRIAREANIPLVHFSTDYVFDGKGGAPYDEGARTKPVNIYGASKLAGEEALTESGCEALVIRSQWLFGCSGRSFPRTMLERARNGKPTRVVDDQRGRPTWTRDLAAATWRLIERGTRGLLHVANAGEATWFDLAREIFVHAGRPELVSRCSTSDYPRPAKRPEDSRLATARSEALLGGPLPPWRLALEQFLARNARS